jgi:hypothetical protein
MSENKTSDYILPLGLLALAFFGGRSILKAIGIIPSDTAAANKALNLPGSPFDPNLYATNTNRLLLTRAAAEKYADQIHGSVHALWFNEPAVFIGVMQAMKTKSQVSYLSSVFLDLYGVGMISYLSQYLSPDQIAAGADIANSLPTFLPKNIA